MNSLIEKSWALVGPGALGLNYSALLAAEGHMLHLLARSDALSLKAQGIILSRVEPKSGAVLKEIAVRPESVATRASEIGPVDIVLIAAKSTVNDQLIESLKALVEPYRTAIVSLQNGMGNAEYFAKFFPDNPILAGLCFVCVNRVAPGVVENYHPGRIEFGSLGDRWPELAEQVAGAFERAGVKSTFSPVLDAALWRKLCWNVPFNGLSIAAGSITCDRILADPELKDRACTLMEEVRDAACAFGHQIEDRFLEGQFSVTEKMGAYQPSSLIDFVSNRPVEIEAIWGEPLRRGTAAGVKMPELERLYTEIKQKKRSRSCAF